MVWVNGQPQEWIAATDRGMQFGDGCFTTARVNDGQVVWLDSHMARLQRDTARLRLPQADWAALREEMAQAASGMAQGVVKVILTRGSGGRGYSARQCHTPTRIVIRADYPSHYAGWRENGVSLGVSPVALARSRLLAGVKHLNRLEQIFIRTQMEEDGLDEVVVLDTAGMLVECCAANLFWRKGNQVFTPDVSQAGVDGVARRHILALLDAEPDLTCRCVSEPVAALAQADEVVICNALMPVVPVNQINTWCYRSRALYRLLSRNG